MRRLLKLGVFLLLGAIVNVAVAWGCFFLPTKTSVYVVDADCVEDSELWLKHAPNGAVFHTEPGWNGSQWNGIGFNGRCFGAWNGPPDERHMQVPFVTNYQVQVQERTYGLPVRSMILEMWEESGQHPPPIDGVWIGKSPFPLRPLWPGFAINIIFYGAILSLLFYAPGKVRRMVRVRRHRCPACGHIIAAGTCANGLCSECGSPLPKGFEPKPDASAHT